MSSTGRAAVRHPAPELPENAFPMAPELEGPPRGGDHMLTYMRLFWEHRRLLARVALYGFLSGAILTFLIPNRYQSTARLMPPENNQSGGSLWRRPRSPVAPEASALWPVRCLA